MSSDPKQPWFREWFDRDYLKVYGHRDARDARLGVALLARALPTLAGMRVLDLGCGPGRHALELDALGAHVVGLDLSSVLLAEAHRQDARLRLVRADMRALPFVGESFAVVVSFFTSFGYFDDAGNSEVLREAARVLRPGGTLLIDYLNYHQALAQLRPESSRRLGSTYVIEARHHDASSGRLVKKIEIQDGSETRRREESVRLYREAELAALVEAAGFEIGARHGDLEGATFDPMRSPRLVLLARRRE